MRETDPDYLWVVDLVEVVFRCWELSWRSSVTYNQPIRWHRRNTTEVAGEAVGRVAEEVEGADPAREEGEAGSRSDPHTRRLMRISGKVSIASSF